MYLHARSQDKGRLCSPLWDLKQAPPWGWDCLTREGTDCRAGEPGSLREHCLRAVLAGAWILAPGLASFRFPSFLIPFLSSFSLFLPLFFAK